MPHLEFLSDTDVKRSLPQNNWLAIATHAKREALALDDMEAFIKRWGRPTKPEQMRKLEGKLRSDPQTYVRALFLREQFVHITQDRDLEKGPQKVRGVEVGLQAMKQSNLLPNLPSTNQLPLLSATLSLKFRLLTPLLTRDDDPFYLFDNPVRKDHIFGLPYLSAASVKGLAADAYQRAFPVSNWKGLGKDDQTRTLNFRRNDPSALRLFGIADDGLETPKGEDESHAQIGRVHFSPVWFEFVQYIIMNQQDADTAKGIVPIQFEAVAPVKSDGKSAVEAELQLFYFNPGDEESIVRTDLARLLASLASWWPTLGIGGKRLAGYGAIQPVSAQCLANGWQGWTENRRTEKGEGSWMTLAEHIATGA